MLSICNFQLALLANASITRYNNVSKTNVNITGGEILKKANSEIREASKASFVPLWRCAAAMNICEVTFIKRLRFELPDAEKASILQIIDELSKENN